MALSIFLIFFINFYDKVVIVTAVDTRTRPRHPEHTPTTDEPTRLHTDRGDVVRRSGGRRNHLASKILLVFTTPTFSQYRTPQTNTGPVLVSISGRNDSLFIFCDFVGTWSLFTRFLFPL